MHYKNGREAKNGDKIVIVPDPKYGGAPVTGVLYDAVAGNDYCNGRIAVITPGDPLPCLNQCLRLDDFLAALALGLDAMAAASDASSTSG